MFGFCSSCCSQLCFGDPQLGPGSPPVWPNAGNPGYTLEPHGRGPAKRSEKCPRMAHLSITCCHAISVLILLYYLYSDEILAVWDPRVTRDVVGPRRVHGKVHQHEVRSDLQVLARILDLPLFGPSLRVVTKLAPKRSSVRDFSRGFSAIQDRTSHWVYKPDVVLELADETVHCHLAVLRARSEFFAEFFDDDDRTRKRWTPEGTMVLDLKRMNWMSMEFVLRFLCAGDDAKMFDSLGAVFDGLPIGGHTHCFQVTSTHPRTC